MLAVYRICYNRRYQHQLIDDPLFVKENFKVRGESLGKVWFPPLTYSPRTKLKLPDLWRVVPLDGFALSTETFSTLPLLMDAGEMLPLKCDDHQLFYFNVTNVVDCLDRERSDYSPNINAVDEFVFKRERLSGSVFRVPETPEVLVVEGIAPPDHDFKAVVERRKLTGLDFDLVWSEVEQ